MFKGTFLAMITNFAIMIVLGIVLNIVGHWFFPADPTMGTNPILQNLEFYLFISFAWGMGGSFISLYMSKFIAKKTMGLQIIDPKSQNSQEREILNMVYDLSRKAGLKVMPEVAIYDRPEVNAFATGPSRSNSLVAVSTGLLQVMNRDEVEGVIGHEVAHIANGDMMAMTMVQGVLNAFVLFFSRIFAILASQGRDGERNFGLEFLLSMVFQVVLGFLAMFVVNWFSRLREFRADKGGARVAGKEKMIAALESLKRTIDYTDADEESAAIATMKISGRSKVFQLLSTHPSLDDRIRRLQTMTSLR